MFFVQPAKAGTITREQLVAMFFFPLNEYQFESLPKCVLFFKPELQRKQNNQLGKSHEVCGGRHCFSYCSWSPVQQKSRLLIGLNCIPLCLNNSSQIAKSEKPFVNSFTLCHLFSANYPAHFHTFKVILYFRSSVSLMSPFKAQAIINHTEI